MKPISYIVILLAVTACGDNKIDNPKQSADSTPQQDRLALLEKSLVELRESQIRLAATVNSDFSNCADSGDTKDPLINRMCKVAQASTVEARVQLKAEIAVLIKDLQEQIDSIATDIERLDAKDEEFTLAIADISSKITAVQSSLTDLTTRMTSAEAAIKALQEAISGLNTTLSGVLEEVQVGKENVSAGPTYESLLRRADRTKILGFVESEDAALDIGSSDPITVTKNSNVAKVSQGGDSLAVGDLVEFSGCAGNSRVSTYAINGEFEVTSVGPTASGKTPFTFTMRKSASGAASVGGEACSAAKVTSRGIGEIWSTSSGADTEVRTTSLGTKPYNYIIKSVNSQWSVCYDKTNASATFATIDALGSNIVCH